MAFSEQSVADYRASHDIRISVGEQHHPPVRHRAECDCGWTGEWHQTEAGARAKGRQHQALAARGWTGLSGWHQG